MEQRLKENARTEAAHTFETLGGDRFEILNFYAVPGVIRRGDSAQLCYGVSNAKTVRLEQGAPVVSDGPYIEAKEYIGSFDIVDCETEERALEIAAMVPFARIGSVEVRPLMHEAAPDV